MYHAPHLQRDIERDVDIIDTIKQVRAENTRRPQQEIDLQVNVGV